MENWPFISDESKVRAVPCLALFGANASGKSNIIHAIGEMRHLIYSGKLPSDSSEKSSHFQPNKIQNLSDTASFEISFTENSNIGLYKIKFTQNEVLEEILTINGDILIAAHRGQLQLHPSLFKDDYDSHKIESIYEVECCYRRKKQIVQNGFLFQVLAKQYAGLSELLFDCFFAMMRIMPFGVEHRFDSYNGEVFEEATQLLKQFDFDIVDIVKTEQGVKTYHINEKQEKIEFDLTDESLGTQVLLTTLCRVIMALLRGLTLIIDEIDRSLHPLLLIEIIRLFKSKEYNTNNAQLLFTTHTTDILDVDNLLRVSEVGIVTKTKKSGTKLHRLSENKELRNVKNFRKSYLEGDFRGIPYPYL